MQKVRAGLIGYGYAGKTIHTPLLLAVESIELVMIATQKSAENVNQDANIIVMNDVQQLIHSKLLELVIIATPNATHYSLAKQCLLAGKHVVVDKPFTLSSVEAAELIELAKSNNLILSVFHNRRWDSDYLTVKKIVEESIIGEAVYFESRFDRFRPEVRDRWREKNVPGGGLWYDLGSHLLDQAVQLFGMPNAIYADLSNIREGAQTTDYFHVLLSYPNTHVILHASMLVAESSTRYILHGTKGSYYKYGLDPQEEQLKSGLSPLDNLFGVDTNDGIITLSSDNKLTTNNFQTQKGDYYCYYNAIAQAILSGTENPVPAVQALNIIKLIELGIRSSDEKKRLDIVI